MLQNLPMFALVIDTDSATPGNFERECCAFCTGIIGDCGVGEGDAKSFAKGFPINPFEDYLDQVPDDHGCLRPVALWPTPGLFNNGMGGHFKPGQEIEAQKHYRLACLDYAERKVYAESRANRVHKEEWQKKSKTPFEKAPAFQSVAIFFGQRPTTRMISIIKRRARKFAAQDGGDWEPFTITGFRLLALSLHEEEVVL